MDSTTADRLRSYIKEYSEQVWPDLSIPEPNEGDLEVVEIRSDGYANAHVEGEHESNKLCPFTSAKECGERWAASEFVECH